MEEIKGYRFNIGNRFTRLRRACPPVQIPPSSPPPMQNTQTCKVLSHDWAGPVGVVGSLLNRDYRGRNPLFSSTSLNNTEEKVGGEWDECVDTGARPDTVRSGEAFEFPRGSLAMDEQVNPLERDHSLSVVLPGGLERSATVHGSKPVMDLLVTLCASYHLNPSDYTVEVLSPNKNNISFKPNSPIGSLEADKIVLKPKGVEEKIRRPYMPEASVRLLINYNKSHKAVVRVSPRVPLEMLLPVVCDKCEFKVETTVLLRDCQSTELLDLTKSLNEHGLREVFARDTAVEHEDPPRTPEAGMLEETSHD
ncbi:cordon-bleu protein-like 1 [Chaetodon trifascialis]|uniref:cordon-bleu protein-like 1 n=1 Tax=Chaetodon trifascialis TaxID=109706 RepID=UPI0039932701